MMRFHVLGLSHTKTTAEYSACAFTQKIRMLCRMLKERGHTVYHYGVEGSEPDCTEHVSVVDAATFQAVHGRYDWRRDGFRIDRENAAYQAFVPNAISAIAARMHYHDFLCCTFGVDHEPIAAMLPRCIPVETGIGYEHTFAPWRVFDSYAWMHHLYGREGRTLTPRWYDAVIPNCVDLADFTYWPEKDTYHMFLGRPTPLKGRDTAIRVCQELGIPLYVAGQGDCTVPEGVTHLGVLGPEDRRLWLSHASAVWVPSAYIEPFGMVAIEAMASGTPVIASDFGGLTETVLHGLTGYRCRTYEQFVWAASHVQNIGPWTCRNWVEHNYTPTRIGAMYEEYFDMLAQLHDDTDSGWYSDNPGRVGLGWLEQRFP